MTPIKTLASLACAAALVACSSVTENHGAQDAAVSADAAARDASDTHDAGASGDAATSADANGTDAGASDASDLDASVADAGACDYIDLNYFILLCGSEYEYGADWVNIAGTTDECPVYTTFRETRYDDAPKAAEGNGCDETCIYRASTSFSIIRCGHRSGYIIYRAADCADLYETPDGIFPSVEAWDEAHPCDDTSTPMPMPPGSS